ncbi:hypothetical protein BC826DRAFT_61366 [Russula brevipes]|nr:hypothetical protein BC826DRAFT_61366 [Russula brevipes]
MWRMLMKETQERGNSAAARSCLLLMVVGTQDHPSLTSYRSSRFLAAERLTSDSAYRLELAGCQRPDSPSHVFRANRSICRTMVCCSQPGSSQPLVPWHWCASIQDAIFLQHVRPAQGPRSPFPNPSTAWSRNNETPIKNTKNGDLEAHSILFWSLAQQIGILLHAYWLCVSVMVITSSAL